MLFTKKIYSKSCFYKKIFLQNRDFQKIFFSKIMLFEKAGKLQNLCILRGKLSQKLIFCVQFFFIIMLFKNKFFFKIALFWKFLFFKIQLDNTMFHHGSAICVEIDFSSLPTFTIFTSNFFVSIERRHFNNSSLTE